MDLVLPSLELPAIRELSALRQWVCWRPEKRVAKGGEERITKIPVMPAAGVAASSTDPKTWSSFEECCAAVVRGTAGIVGIGFVLCEQDPYVGIDLDKCLDAAGVLEPWALEIVRLVRSYTEISPSGSGLHILARAKLPAGWRKHGRVEIYESARYLTVTGRVFEPHDENHVELFDRTPEVAELHARHARPSAVNPYTGEDLSGLRLDPDANPPVERFEAAKANDRKFKLSWEHRRTDLADTSLSNYDLSLAVLALRMAWTPQQVADLLIAHRRQWGGLDKALRASTPTSKGYVARTIETAIGAIGEGLQDKQADLHELRSEEMTSSSAREEAIARVAEMWRLPVKGCVRIGRDEPTYVLLIGNDRAQVEIGPAEALLSQNHVRARMLDATGGIVMPRMKEERWGVAVGLLVQHAEVVDLLEIEPVQQARSWVREYVELRGVGDPKEWLRLGWPIEFEDAIHVNSSDLARWIFVTHGERLTPKRVALRLRSAGLEQRSVAVRIGSKTTGRSYWRVWDGFTTEARVLADLTPEEGARAAEC